MMFLIKIFKSIATILFISLLIGCASSSVTGQFDKFKKEQICKTSKNNISLGAFSGDIQLDFIKTTPTNGKPSYEVHLEWKKETNIPDHYPYIKKGNSLALLLDNMTSIQLTSEDGGFARTITSGWISPSHRELSVYKINAEDIKKIANASIVEFKVYGHKFDVKGQFKSNNIAAVNNFVNSCCVFDGIAETKFDEF